MTTAKTGFAFSLHPDDAIEGGLADNFEGTLVGYEYKDYDYINAKGEVTARGPALVLTISQDDPPNDSPVVQPYGLGGKEGAWEYSDDGKEIINGPRGQLTKTAGATKLMMELSNIGMDINQAKGTSKLDFMVGAKFKWQRKETPLPFGTEPRRDAQGREQKHSTLFPTKLISTAERTGRIASGTAQAGRPAAQGANGKAAVAPPPVVEISSEQIDLVFAVLKQAGSPKKPEHLVPLIATARGTTFADDAHRQLRASSAKLMIVSRMVEDGLLIKGEDGLIQVPA